MFSVIDLGTLAGSTSVATAINNLGQVVGIGITNTGLQHATLFSGTGSGNFDLATPGSGHGSASGINDSGRIVGSEPTQGILPGRLNATLFSGTSSGNVDLGAIGGHFDASALAVNNSGQVIGTAMGSGDTHATLFSGSGSANTDLDTLSFRSYAKAINDNGLVVGVSSATFNSPGRATLFSGTGSGNIDLGTLGGDESSAAGINNAGQIVGYGQIAANQSIHATMFSGNGIGNLDLGTLSGGRSYASDINNNGWVVGKDCADGTNSFCTGFLWQTGIGMLDIQSLIDPLSAWNLEDAAAINDLGQIAANGCNRLSGACHALLLTLIPDGGSNTVPEPSSLALLGVGAMAIVATRRRNSIDNPHRRKICT